MTVENGWVGEWLPMATYCQHIYDHNFQATELYLCRNRKISVNSLCVGWLCIFFIPCQQVFDCILAIIKLFISSNTMMAVPNGWAGAWLALATCCQQIHDCRSTTAELNLYRNRRTSVDNACVGSQKVQPPSHLLVYEGGIMSFNLLQPTIWWQQSTSVGCEHTNILSSI